MNMCTFTIFSKRPTHSTAMNKFDENLEKLLLPSKWSDRLAPEVIVDKHIEFASAKSESSRRNIPSTLNISYGLLNNEKIDIFGTDLQNDSNILVFVHGGYWQETALKRDTYHYIASNLYKNGIKSIFVGYELCPQVTLHEIVKEIEVAIKKCIAYAKENNSKGLVLLGYSAGSQLVAALFTDLAENFTEEDRSFIKSGILIAGIYDLTQIPKTSINVPLKLDDEEAFRLSPQKRDLVDKVTTKFYVISAEKDSPEFRRQSEEFCKKFKEVGIVSEAMVIDKVDHFDVVELLDDEEFQVSRLVLKLCQN